MAKTVWLIAGEASGDIYGAAIIKALHGLDPSLQIKFMGGAEMQKTQDLGTSECMVDSTELGVMGIIEVLKMYPTFKRIFNSLVKKAYAERPDAVIMIDYPGFNVRLAKKLYAKDIPVIYYIGPQVWAWGKKRIPLLKEIVAKMIVIFPFEVPFWQKHDVDAVFVGHPLVEELAKQKIDEERDENLIALLPGSRFSEISRLLKPMLDTAKQLVAKDPQAHFVLPTPRESISLAVREEIAAYAPSLKDKIKVATGESVYWMQKASTGLAASGTVTVQAAILGLPLVSVYRLNAFTYWLVKRKIDLPFFTMVNIIAEKEVYREFIQDEVCATNLVPAVESILPKGNRRAEIEAELSNFRSKLGGAGQETMPRTAKEIIDFIGKL